MTTDVLYGTTSGAVADVDTELRLDPTSLVVTSQPARGTAVVNPATHTVTFTDAAAGGPQTQVSYTYRVCDANSDLADGPEGMLCDTATVTVHFTQPQLTAQLDPDTITASPNQIVQFTVSYWNDGPGTAYNTTVGVSTGSGCSVITANPVFSGNLGALAAGFETVRVQAPNADGVSCDVTASIASSNGTAGSDISTIDVPAAAALGASMGPSFRSSPTPSMVPGDGSGAASATPTIDPSATVSATPVAAVATPTIGANTTVTATPVVAGASPTMDPNATATATSVAASATSEGSVPATDTPVPASATADGSPTDTAVPADTETAVPAETDTPHPATTDTSAPPAASSSATPQPAPPATDVPVAASSAGPAGVSGGVWLWLQLLIPLSWLAWMLGIRKDKKGGNGT